jgi:hypothetical protein
VGVENHGDSKNDVISRTKPPPSPVAQQGACYPPRGALEAHVIGIGIAVGHLYSKNNGYGIGRVVKKNSLAMVLYIKHTVRAGRGLRVAGLKSSALE